MQEEKGKTEDEMVGWHLRLHERKFEQALGVGDGQVSLVCCSPWGCKKWDTTERLNRTELNLLKTLLSRVAKFIFKTNFVIYFLLKV